MTMRLKFLVTTAATSLIIGSGIAAAQDRDDTIRSHSPKATQTQSQKSNHDRIHNQNADKTTGQAPSSDDQSRANTVPDKSKNSTSGASDADRSKSHNRLNDRGDQKGATASEKPNNASGSAVNSDDHKPQSGENKPSSAAQTNSSTERQPSNAANTQPREPAAAQQSTTDRNAANSSQGTPSRGEATNTGRAQSTTRVSASLQTADKTKLDRAVAKIDVKPVTSVNFSVSVGTAVPDTVTLHPVPSEIVTIIPQYRGYDFFLVKNEFVIVEPQSHKIVDVIERSGTHAEATTTTKSKVNLSKKDRAYIRKHVTTRRTGTTGAAPRSERVIVGEDAPEAVEIDSFPEDVYREVPAVRSYRYIHSGNDVYLVEPGSRRVIESIGDED